MYYGASYYPEHKTKEELKHDIELLSQSGINTVRMGEFSWCRMEPEPGKYDFKWLLETVEELGKAGIRTVICTPTACPPAHLVSAHPEILYVDNRGITRPFGGRRHYCYNNPVYREASATVTRELAKVFGKHKDVLGFQIDNEPAQEGTGRCHCPVCQAKFQNWLQEKYGDISELNRHWGTIFWSMEYQNFKQIFPPVNTIEKGAAQTIGSYYENPGLRLDFERFCSESQIEYQNIQADILKEYSDKYVTTNATGLATNSIDYYKSFASLTQYAFDYYPNLRSGEINAFPYAFARGIKEDTPFWVLEFVSGGGHKLNGGGRMQSPPGALKQSVVHAMANGAQMLLHFQFRSFPFGAEQLNYAIVDTDGVPRRRYREMQETAELLGKLKEAELAEFRNEVAVCFDYEALWALKMKPANSEYHDYIPYETRFFNLLARNGIGADVVSFESDLSKYKMVIVPTAFVMSRKIQQKLTDYCKNGGTLLATFLTSVKDEYNTGYTDTLPAGLTEVFGVTVEEVDPVYGENHTKLCLKLDDGKEYIVQDGIWSELLGGAARTVAAYTEDYKKGSKVIGSHAYGRGKAVYLGTDLPDEAMQELLKQLTKDAGIDRIPFEIPQGIQAVRRFLDENEIYYLFNFTGKPASMELPEGMENLVTGEVMGRTVTFDRNGFAVLKHRSGC